MEDKSIKENMEKDMKAMLALYEEFVAANKSANDEAAKFASGKLTNTGFTRFRNSLNEARKAAFELRQLSNSLSHQLKDYREATKNEEKKD